MHDFLLMFLAAFIANSIMFFIFMNSVIKQWKKRGESLLEMFASVIAQEVKKYD